MRTYWETKKSLENEHVRIEFQCLMEDMRDIMSDNVKPDMERNPYRNRISCYDKSRDFVTAQVDVPKNIGNYYYKLMKDMPDSMEYFMDQCYLDVCAYYNDFDAYSDTFKDINNVRPHYTKEQWDMLVNKAQNLK